MPTRAGCPTSDTISWVVSRLCFRQGKLPKGFPKEIWELPKMLVLMVQLESHRTSVLGTGGVMDPHALVLPEDLASKETYL